MAVLRSRTLPVISRRLIVGFMVFVLTFWGFFRFENKASAAVATWYVEQGGVGNCSAIDNACGTIALALAAASSGDTIIVKAGNYNAGAGITVNKSVKILGYNAAGTVPAYTLYHTSESSGPTISGGLLANFILAADEIQISGFNIDTTGLTTTGISIASTVKYPIIEYDHFTFDGLDSAILVSNVGKLISPAGINYNLFDGPAASNAFSVQVIAGGEIDRDAGYAPPESWEPTLISSGLSFFHNTFNHCTTLLADGDGSAASTGLRDIAFLYNTFSDGRGFIIFEKGGATNTAKIHNIEIWYNTFNNSLALDSQTAVLIGNTVGDSDVLGSWDSDFMIFFNKFLQTRDSTYPTVGFENPTTTNPSSSLLAWANWWGNADGPAIFDTPGHNQATISSHISYNPWSVDANYSEIFIDISSFAGVDGSSSFLPSAFTTYLKQGSFIFPLPSFFSDLATFFDDPSQFLADEGDDFDITLPNYLLVHDKAVFEIPQNGGTTIITLPAGTKITAAVGSTLDTQALTMQAKAISAVSGLPEGSQVFGAAELGIPNVGLSFDQAVEAKVFLGSAYNGQILSIRRSTSGSGDWTTEGLVNSSNCTVADGYCTFQSLKASTFVVASFPLTSSMQILPETGSAGKL